MHLIRIAQAVRGTRTAVTAVAVTATVAVLGIAAPATATDGLQARDPFAAFGSDGPPASPCTDTRGVVCVPIDTLTLRGVVTATASPRAMFEDAAGKSIMVRVGDTVGGMRVKAMRRGTVVLERTLHDWIGRVTKTDVVITL